MIKRYALFLLIVFVLFTNSCKEPAIKIIEIKGSLDEVNETRKIKTPKQEFQSAKNLPDLLQKVCYESGTVKYLNFSEEDAKSSYTKLDKPMNFKEKHINSEAFEFYYFPSDTEYNSFFFNSDSVNILYFGQSAIPENSLSHCPKTDSISDGFTAWKNNNKQGYYLILYSDYADGSKSYNFQSFDDLASFPQVIDNQQDLRAYSAAINALKKGADFAAFPYFTEPESNKYRKDISEIQMLYIIGDVYDENSDPVNDVLIRADFVDQNTGLDYQTKSKTIYKGKFILEVPCGIQTNIEFLKENYSKRLYENEVFTCNKPSFNDLCLGNLELCDGFVRRMPVFTRKPEITEVLPNHYSRNTKIEDGVKLTFSVPMKTKSFEQNLKIYQIPSKSFYHQGIEEEFEEIIKTNSSKLKQIFSINDFNIEWNSTNSEVQLQWKTIPKKTLDNSDVFVVSLENDSNSSKIESKSGLTNNNNIFYWEDKLLKYYQFIVTNNS